VSAASQPACMQRKKASADSQNSDDHAVKDARLEQQRCHALVLQQYAKHRCCVPGVVVLVRGTALSSSAVATATAASPSGAAVLAAEARWCSRVQIVSTGETATHKTAQPA
jgi:hypothetical protein